MKTRPWSEACWKAISLRRTGIRSSRPYPARSRPLRCAEQAPSDVQTEHRENGLVAVRQIKAERPQIKIVVVTSLLDGAVLEEAKSAGADSLWYKDSAKNRLMEVVRRTMAGERVFPDAPPTVEIGMAKSTEFTKTEMKVLRHLLRGLSYTRIAAEMGCEMSTVKFHVANMLQKTGLENKLQLALAVSNTKLVADLSEE